MILQRNRSTSAVVLVGPFEKSGARYNHGPWLLQTYTVAQEILGGSGFRVRFTEFKSHVLIDLSRSTRAKVSVAEAQGQ